LTKFYDIASRTCSLGFRDDERKILHFLAASRRPLTTTELLFLLQKVHVIDPIRLEQALSTLHSSSMLKRSPVDSRSSDGTIVISLTDVATAYIARFAPPDKSILDKVQAATKQLRDQMEASTVRQAAYEFDVFAVRAKTKDERICAYHLNRALEASRKYDFVAARKEILEAKKLHPSFSEAYRVAALVETRAGELYQATQEIEDAVQYDPKSALIHYQYANFLLNQLDDSEGALKECELAIKWGSSDEALITLKALILTRLGKYPEALEIYELMLKDIQHRPHKWRVSTRDQAAECYRRFGERDRLMRDVPGFKKHLDRACSILDEAIAEVETDAHTGILYASIIEDALFFAIQTPDEEYGIAQFDRLSDASHILSIPNFRKLRLESFAILSSGNFGLAVRARGYFDDLDRRSANIASLQACSDGDDVVTARAKYTPLDKPYVFLRDAGDVDWFLSRSSLRQPADWTEVREGTLIQFTPVVDSKSRRQATEAIIIRHGRG
jgi:tetratricopeptide (TPR) repeat protein